MPDLQAPPSRFQIGDKVRLFSARGTVEAVIFAIIEGRNRVFYDVRYGAGVFRRVDSDDVGPAIAGHLHVVDGHHADQA